MKQSSVRRALLALALTLVLVAGGVLTWTAPSTAALLPTCLLTPQLRDATVNQGLGSYADGPLVRGKTTLVRLYLEMPACADAGDYIEITSATLNVQRKNGLLKESLGTVSAAPQPVSVFPRVAPYGGAPANDWSGDPLFVVPGTMLAPASVTTAMDIEFSADVVFRAVDNGTAGSATTARFSPTNNARLAAKYSTATNSLKILVVPMGNSADTTPFPSESTSAVENGMRALSRILPIADGIGDLQANPTGGLRYSISPGLIDLGPRGLNVMIQDASKKYVFCGARDSFDSIKAQLAAKLTAWNSITTNVKADKVVGVVPGSVSTGYPACAEGWASLVSNESWVRAVPSADGTPTITGATLGMEVAHTFGEVPGDRDDGFFHSPNKEADLTSPNRAYNTTFRQFLMNDRSVMGFTPPGWDGTNTLLEKADWTLIECSMTPGWTAGGCARPGSVGSAGSITGFVISGTTNVTTTSDPSTDRTEAHSYYASGTPGEADPNSEYTLVQVSKGVPVKTEGVPVRWIDSAHDGHDHAHTAATGLFEFGTTVVANADRIELRHVNRSQPLYARDINAAPEIESAVMTGGAATNISDPGSGDRPNFSRDGEWIAYRDGASIRIARRDKSVVTSPFAGSDPAFSADGKSLAYVNEGSIYMRSFDPVSGALGAAAIVYDRNLEQELNDILGSSVASDPSWSPDGDLIAFQVGTTSSDVFILSVSQSRQNSLICRWLGRPGDRCYPLTRDHISSTPSWSADNRIAFVRTEVLSGQTIYVGSPTLASAASSTGLKGTLPAWSNELLAYRSGGGIWAAKASDFTDATQITDANDAWPSLRADAKELVVARTATDGSTDAVVIDLSRRTVRVKARDEFPGVLRLDVFVECDAATFPLAVAQKPVSTGGAGAEFVVPIDPARACGGGEILVRVTDGYRTAWRSVGFLPEDPNGGTSEDSGYPAGAIYSPPSGATLTQYRLVALAGTAVDEDGTVPDSRLRWRLQRPDGTVSVVGTGSTPPDLSPAAGGWAPGTYITYLDVLEEGTFEESARSTFTVLKDADNDNRPATACSENDSNPNDAFADADSDSIVNVDDPQPCVSANNATVSFDPQTLYVPSSGNDVTLSIKSSAVNLAGVDPSTVEIVKVGQWYTTGLKATAYSYDSKSKTAQAKFNRAQLTQFMHERGLVNRYVPIVVSGRSGTTSFRGFDPRYPYASQS